MEFLAENLWIVWLIVAAVLLVVELNTTALVSIWFVLAAIVTAIIAPFWDNIIAQVIIFFVLSAVFLILFRKLYKNKIQGKYDTDVEYTPVGKLAVTEETVTKHEGKVRVDGVFWKAVCDEAEISPGTTVSVVSAEGTTLKVKSISEKGEVE